MGSDTFSARLRRSAAMGAAVAAMGLPAYAQQTPTTPPSTDQVDQIKPAPKDDNAPPQQVIITGTRLPNQFETASPIEIIAAKDADAKGISDLASLLRDSTVASGSPQITAITSTAFTSINGINQIGGQGVESLSLRGLGANRTLVLLDGKRAGPAGTQGQVAAFDLNVLPLSAIERVDILKDGASTVYGSDAIAGVVNIITKKDDTSNIEAFYSAPQHGGGEQTRINGTYGAHFGNGTFRITADYYKQNELTRGNRSYLDCGSAYVFDNQGKRADIVDPRTGKPNCTADLPVGQIWVYDYSGAAHNAGSGIPFKNNPGFLQYGNLGAFVPHLGSNAAGISTPSNLFPVGYLNNVGDPAFAGSARNSEAIYDYHSPYQDTSSLQPEVERMTVFANGNYDFNDHVSAYANVLLNRRTTKIHAYTQFWTFQYVYNYGGTPGGDPQAAADGISCTACVLSPTAATDHAGSTVQVDYARALVGFKGDFDFIPFLKGWTWDLSTQFSHSYGYYKSEIIFNDAITPYQFAGAGGATCATLPVTPQRGAPCVQIDWYSPHILTGNLTAAERAFLFGVDIGKTEYDQIASEAYVSGELPWALPAGKIGVVAGLDYQNDKIDDVPDPKFQNGLVWTGGPSQGGETKGNDYTRAAFTEVSIPIIKDLPLVKGLELTGSARYTYVGSYGDDTTWKYGLNWEVNDWLRFRAGRGTSFRSPALYELYLAPTTSFASQRADPCINWGAALASGAITQNIANNCLADGIPNNHSGAGVTESVISQGGAGHLKAETSDAKTIGVVFSPADLNLQLSIDYFDISVENEVAQLGASNILFTCYNSTNHATDPTCSLFTRIPAGQPGAFNLLSVDDDYINIASQHERGLDIEALWRWNLPVGRINIKAEASKDLRQDKTLLPGSPPKDSAGLIGYPRWVGNVDTTYTLGKWSFFYGLRYVGSTNNYNDYVSINGTTENYFGTPVNYVLSTRPYLYSDVSVSYDLPWKSNIRVGISNLTDKKPPFVTTISGEYGTVGNVPLDGSNYDFFGRTFFVNITKDF